MHQCPTCQSSKEQWTVVGPLANCTECGGVFEVDPTDLPLPEPPSCVRTATLPDGLEITLPWRWDMSLLQKGVGFVLFGMMGLQMFILEASIMAVPFLLIGILIAYVGLVTAVNSTTIVVRPDGVDIHHGPLPARACNATLSAAEVVGTYVETVEQRTRNGHTTHHDLNDGRHMVVLTRWNRIEGLNYVRDVIAQIAKPVT